MKQTEFKQLIKECITEIMGEMESHEPYDAETDTMVPAPRDRTEPSSGVDKLTQAMQKLNKTASLLRTLSKVCEKHGLPNLAKASNDAYYDIIKFTRGDLREGDKS